MLTLLLAASTLPSIDVFVDGPGMLRFVREGRTVFAKTATLVADGGQVRHVDGPPLLPSIAVAKEVAAIDVDPEGNVYSIHGGTARKLGRISLALFPDERKLTGDADFWLSSERAQLGNPGEGSAGRIRVIKPRAIAPRSAPSSSTPGLTITIPSESEVGAGRILLGHVARFTGDPDLVHRASGIYLFEAPPVGSSRTLDRQLVLGRLRTGNIAAGAASLQMPPGAKVRQRSQAVPHSRFVELACQEAKRRLGFEAPVRSADDAADFVAPVGTLGLEVERCVKDDSRVLVTIAVRVDGRRINSRQVVLVPEASAEGVKAGAAVKIVFIAAGAEVEIAGRARSSGWVGQSVTVSTETGSTHTGTVVGPNRVEVRM